MFLLVFVFALLLLCVSIGFCAVVFFAIWVVWVVCWVAGNLQFTVPCGLGLCYGFTCCFRCLLISVFEFVCRLVFLVSCLVVFCACVWIAC